MSSGRRNRLITIQQRVTTVTDTGSREVQWTQFAQVFAEKRDSKVGATEKSHSATLYPILKVEWVIRYLPGLESSMRVLYEGQVWEIIDIADDSFRRDYRVLLCELRGNGSTSAGLTCQPAVYRNDEDAPTFEQTINSGAIFTAPKITVTQVTGAEQEVNANEDIQCAWGVLEVFDTDGNLIETVPEYPKDGVITVPASGGPCDDAVYSNGDAFQVSIPSGDTYVAPEIEITDVDGSTRNSVPNVGVVCEWKVLSGVDSQGVPISNTDVNSYPAGGLIVYPDRRIEDGSGNDVGLPYRNRTSILNAEIASVVNDTPAPNRHNVTLAPTSIRNSDGLTLLALTDYIGSKILPDTPLTDDNGAVGSYPVPTSIVIDGEVDTAGYSAGVLTIKPVGGSAPPTSGMFAFGTAVVNSAIPTQDVAPIFLSALQPTAVAIGANHGLAIIGGTLYGWGEERALGIANTGNYTPITQLDATTGYTSIAAGNGFSLAVRSGTLRVTGINANGQLGLGNTTNQFTWVQVGTDTDYSMVSCGDLWSAIIKAGNVLTSGSNANFRTGQNTASGNTTTHAAILSNGTATFIDCGGNFGGAIDAGRLYTWGTNGNGRTAQGTASGNTQAATQVGSDTDWSMIALNATFGLGLKTTGQIQGWGANGSGQLADGSTTQRLSPVNSGADTDWNYIDTRVYNGGGYVIARKTNGHLYGAGDDGQGQLNLTTGNAINNTWIQITNFAVTAYATDGGTIYVR